MKTDFLYIHIPFCIKKCIYCDFFSIPYDESAAKKYIEGLCKELFLKRDSVNTLRTIYIGGGTPSVLPDDCFKQLFECLRDNFNLSPSVEITVEANPGTLHESNINTLLSIGVNRLSIGIQSFDNDELKTLGRIHTLEDSIHSINLIKKAGMKNFSIDLMYGIPGQTMESWNKSLSQVTGLSPTHISTYELTLEEKTPLYGLIKSNGIKMPDEDLILQMYNHATDYLASCGYEHYEISNFALSGFRCIHNLNYWDRGKYIGVGAGAHSFSNGIRTMNTRDIAHYIENLNSGFTPEIESSKLTPEEAMKEFIFLGLRKTEGINIKELPFSITAIYNTCHSALDAESMDSCFRRNDLFKLEANIQGKLLCKLEEFGIKILEASRELIDEGYLEIEGRYLRLTRKGIVISNTVIVKLFEQLGL